MNIRGRFHGKLIAKKQDLVHGKQNVCITPCNKVHANPLNGILNCFLGSQLHWRWKYKNFSIKSYYAEWVFWIKLWESSRQSILCILKQLSSHASTYINNKYNLLSENLWNQLKKMNNGSNYWQKKNSAGKKIEEKKPVEQKKSTALTDMSCQIKYIQQKINI